MTNRPWLLPMLQAVGILAGLSTPASARELTLYERVQHQRAIEEVYWRHRIWPQDNPTPKPALSEVMTDAAIRAKVEDYLKKSTALETVWHHPVTGEQLQAELDRMVRDTRSVATLKELFHALGDDPFVIGETLARQTLVDRLARDWYSSDSRFHGETERQAEAARAACRTVSQMRAMGGEYREVTVVRRRDNSTLQANGEIQLDASEWEEHRTSLARRFQGAGSRVGRLGNLEETRDAFTLTAVLLDRTDETQLATVTFAKTPFDNWWSQLRPSLSAAVGTTSGPYRLASPSDACIGDTWRSTNVGVPRPRVWHTAVWTGSEMIVWGGYDNVSNTSYADGARYNPATDTWGPISAGASAPSTRLQHTAVWTGTEMIVWGGVPAGSSVTLNTGGRYNPLTDAWTATSTAAGVPAPRQQHTAVWSGSVMVVWGGGSSSLNTGGIYNPSSNSWTATSLVGAPSGRSLHTAVWTGSQMIVWGGAAAFVALNDGARFNPASNTWTSMSAVAAPSVRQNHTAVWDGSGMIVWGGETGNFFDFNTNTGARYVPATDTWTATSTTAGVPTARGAHNAVWTGTRMLVWGGNAGGAGAGFNTGSSFDPLTQTWTALPTVNAPPGRYSASAVWTGTEMIIWGGDSNSSTPLSTGGRYNPASATWLATSTTTVPSERYGHSSVWTGSEMIIWGGYESPGPGARYIPTTNSWIPTAPGPNIRPGSGAIWTGTEMIVWGGNGASVGLGSRYNPSTNVWSPVTDTNAPALRTDHTAVWTGSVMIVWGGMDPGTQLAKFDGGRYNPATNTWAATSLTGAPARRLVHAAVWTGTSMVIWGGGEIGTSGVNTGGRYDPIGDAWTQTSLGPGVPSPRWSTATVWTGSRMTVWSGGGLGIGSSGALYDPVADTWTAMSTGANVPEGRSRASAVWTGTEMIVWGGNDFQTVKLNSGGRYNPASDTWAPMSNGANLPAARAFHTSEWTGTEVAIWGGTQGLAPGLSSGGLYCVPVCATPSLWYLDADLDGFGQPGSGVLSCTSIPGRTLNSTDCNDGNAGIHPGANEQCGVVDRNCDGLLETVVPGEIVYQPVQKIGGVPRFSWIAPAGVTRFDHYRGIYAGAIGTDPFSEFCLGNDTTQTFWDDPNPPELGTFWWFLISGVNSCGRGTLGFRTDHATPTTERISVVCP